MVENNKIIKLHCSDDIDSKYLKFMILKLLQENDLIGNVRIEM